MIASSYDLDFTGTTSETGTQNYKDVGLSPFYLQAILSGRSIIASTRIYNSD